MYQKSYFSECNCIHTFRLKLVQIHGKLLLEVLTGKKCHMQMYKWMQCLVSLGAVVAEDRFCALDWEHWQWKLFSLSKRTCRSFSGV